MKKLRMISRVSVLVFTLMVAGFVSAKNVSAEDVTKNTIKFVFDGAEKNDRGLLKEELPVDDTCTVTKGSGDYSLTYTAKKDGVFFTGWFTAKEGGEQVYNSCGGASSETYWDCSNEVPTWKGISDLTLYPHWSTTPEYVAQPVCNMDRVLGGFKIKIKPTAFAIDETTAAVGKKFEIYRATGNGKFVKIATTTKKEYVDKKVKYNKEYTYKVIAFYNETKSEFSSTVAMIYRLEKPVFKVFNPKKTSKGVKFRYRISTRKNLGYKIYFGKSAKKATKVLADTKGKRYGALKTTKLSKGTYYLRARYYTKNGKKTEYSAYSKTVKVVFQ
ncbi:MAG: hypothetical protein K6G64_04995 [Eubacterium sp.]|nr:hypothetical protein [Eubacterium sp.]